MKKPISSNYEQTLLGELLLRRGLIRRRHIEKALAIQKVTQQRLGEVLIGQGWLCERQLDRALRLQRRLRLALGIVSLASLPALSLAEVTALPQVTQAAGSPTLGHLVALDEHALGAISAGSVSPRQALAVPSAAPSRDMTAGADVAARLGTLAALLEQTHLRLLRDAGPPAPSLELSIAATGGQASAALTPRPLPHEETLQPARPAAPGSVTFSLPVSVTVVSH